MVPWLWLIGMIAVDDSGRTWGLVPLASRVALRCRRRVQCRTAGWAYGKSSPTHHLGWAVLVSTPAVASGIPIVVTTLVVSVFAAWTLASVQEQRAIRSSFGARVLRMWRVGHHRAAGGRSTIPGGFCSKSDRCATGELQWLERIAGFLVVGYSLRMRGRSKVVAKRTPGASHWCCDHGCRRGCTNRLHCCRARSGSRSRCRRGCVTLSPFPLQSAICWTLSLEQVTFRHVEHRSSARHIHTGGAMALRAPGLSR